MDNGRLKDYKTSLITGATGGIGYEFSRLLGEKGKELILVSRNKERLEQLRHEFERDYKIKVHVFKCDLTEENDLNRLIGAIGKSLPEVDLLINNAGVGIYGGFGDLDIGRQVRLVKLNVIALMELAHKAMAGMAERGRGGVLNVASTSGFMSIPFNSVYSATKAFVINFSRALARETKDKNIVVSCLCPGITDTGYWKAAGMQKLKDRRRIVHSPAYVAEYGLYLVDKGKDIGIPGPLLKLKHFMRCLAPDGLITDYMYKHMRPGK